MIEQANRDINKVAHFSELVMRFAELGVYPKPGTPKALGDFVREQRASWKKVVTELGLQPQ